MVVRAWVVAFMFGIAGVAVSGCAKGYVIVTCSTCQGGGKAKCSKCTSAGMAVCGVCRGWGVQCCPACAEKPQQKLCGRCKDQLRNCVKCNGTGGEDCFLCDKGIKKDGQTCHLCKGKGSQPCRYCKEGKDGTCVCCGTPPKAEVRATLAACVPCAGKGSLKCPACGGTTQVTCARCGGGGKVKSETKGGGLFKGKDWD